MSDWLKDNVGDLAVGVACGLGGGLVVGLVWQFTGTPYGVLWGLGGGLVAGLVLYNR